MQGRKRQGERNSGAQGAGARTAATATAATATAVTRNAVTRNAVTRNAVTRNAVTRNAVTRNAVTRSASTPALRAPGLARCRGPVLLVVNDPGRTAPGAPPAHCRTALVVDDDPLVRRALTRRLRPELDVYVAASVREARELSCKLDRIDLALVDLELPDGSGEEVLQLVARWPDAISVLMSGSFREGGAGADAMLDSPALDSRPLDARTVDNRPLDARTVDNRPLDARTVDNRPLDARTVDNRPLGNHPPHGCPLQNRALANLVLAKPIASRVIDALKKAVLELARD
jgi:CheY-like chemotaxis protein